MVYKIAFIGNPCTGKTTCSKYLNKQYSMSLHKAHFVPEYARQYIVELGGINNMRDQYNVSIKQMLLEMEGEMSGKEVVISEVPQFLGVAYSRMYFLQGVKDHAKYERLREMVSGYKYDVIFYCGNTGIYEDDGVRYQRKEELERLERIILETLKEFHDGKIIYLPRSREARERVLQEFQIRQSMGEYNEN